MRGFTVLLGCLSLALAAYVISTFPSEVPATAGGPSFDVRSTAGATPIATPPADPSPSTPPTFCPGRTWPPYPLGGIPGITVVSTDRTTITITNRTSKTYYYRVSGWQTDQFEFCRALGEVEFGRGPIAPGATERVGVASDWQRAAPVTVGLWDKPCGEACVSEPVAALIVELSPVAPASS